MAEILKKITTSSKDAWKGGLGAGALTGVLQGGIGLLGAHQFFSRMIGGVISATIIKNKTDKRVILLESSKEAIFQLLAGE